MKQIVMGHETISCPTQNNYVHSRQIAIPLSGSCLFIVRLELVLIINHWPSTLWCGMNKDKQDMSIQSGWLMFLVS